MVLPASKPASLNAAIAANLERDGGRTMKGSTSGGPLIFSHGKMGPVLERRDGNDYILKWGLSKENPTGRIKIL